MFHLPRAGALHLELDAAELTLLLDGIELTAATRRPRYHVHRARKTKADLLKAMEKHVVGQAELMGRYQRK